MSLNIDRIIAEEKFNKKFPGLYLDILAPCLEVAANNQRASFNGTVPMIPELNVQADQVCNAISQLMKYYIKQEELNLDVPGFTAKWCLLAGMGAVWYWDKDWPDLKNTGIVDKLVAPEGIEGLDDVVLDEIGIGRSTSEARNLRNYIDSTVKGAIQIVPPECFKESEEFTFVNLYKAMYMLGIAMEMYRLGMR